MMRANTPLATPFGALALLALALSGPFPAIAEPLRKDLGAVGLRQTLRRIESPYRVLHIVAHPDDEDGGTLTYLSRGLGADVVIASVTRGESGANLVSGDFFDALGVLRTLEYRRAAQYYGVRLRFTRYADFGYSKTLAETLRNWDREQVLGDLVRIVREERPHVILARWQGGPRDGHGHHQAAGLLAQDAYRAAADPTRFPEQIAAGIKPWRALKLYSGNRRENDDWTITVDAGVYDPLLGESYAQTARQGLRAQRSQGAGSSLALPGPSLRRYKLLASEVGLAEREESFFERIELSIPRELARPMAEATRRFRAENPSDCVGPLLEALRAVRSLRQATDSADLERKEELIETAIHLALGVRLDFLVEPKQRASGPFAAFQPYETFSLGVPGQTFEASLNLYAGAGDVGRREIRVDAPEGWKVEELAEDRRRVTVAADAAPTAVHWSRESVWDVAYAIDDPDRWGRALPAAPLTAKATYWVEDVPVRIEAVAETSYLDFERVQRRRALAVAPAVSVEIATDAGVLPASARDYPLTLRLRNNASRSLAGELRLDLPVGWSARPASAAFSFEREGEEREITVTVQSPANTPAGVYPLRAEAVYEGGKSSVGFRRITRPGLESAYLSRPARHEIRVVDVETAPNLRVGYVMGAGDSVPDGVRQLGAEVTMLGAEALASGDLSQYDTILLGIRAYAAREDVKTHNARLLAYVEQGGVLVVQYNTPEYDENYGPFPYRMTRRPEEVSEEDSPVRILDPEDPVFNWPNAITQADFDGWVEQRGSKFLVEWDERYKPLLETHDEGQAPQSGGWVVARHGKGLYVYCAYAWYRQLPYGVPGAARIFANLISLGAPEAPWRSADP